MSVGACVVCTNTKQAEQIGERHIRGARVVSLSQRTNFAITSIDIRQVRAASDVSRQVEAFSR